MDKITVMGIDPSTTSTGLAVLHGYPMFILAKYEFSYAIKPPPQYDIEERNHIVVQSIGIKIIEYHPDVVIIERPHSNPKNLKSSIDIAMLTGRIIEVSRIHCGSYILLPPAQVKKAVTRNGRATKAQVKQAVESLFGIECQSDDESDALAIAYTYLLEWQRETSKQST